MAGVVIGMGRAVDDGECSRAGCREPATHRIDWRNPRIHTGDRGKTWLACDEHVEFLRGFLASRSFPLEVTAFAQAGAASTGAGPSVAAPAASAPSGPAPSEAAP